MLLSMSKMRSFSDFQELQDTTELNYLPICLTNHVLIHRLSLNRPLIIVRNVATMAMTTPYGTQPKLFVLIISIVGNATTLGGILVA